MRNTEEFTLVNKNIHFSIKKFFLSFCLVFSEPCIERQGILGEFFFRDLSRETYTRALPLLSINLNHPFSVVFSGDTAPSAVVAFKG